MKPYSIALILTSDGGTHYAIAFWTSFFLAGWSKLLNFSDFQLPILFLSSRLLSFHSSGLSSPNLQKITKNERAPPR